MRRLPSAYGVADRKARSGLDTQSAHQIVLFMRRLASTGIPVLATIHQPVRSALHALQSELHRSRSLPRSSPHSTSSCYLSAAARRPSSATAPLPSASSKPPVGAARPMPTPLSSFSMPLALATPLRRISRQPRSLPMDPRCDGPRPMKRARSARISKRPSLTVVSSHRRFTTRRRVPVCVHKLRR